ncbi:MAG TPA: ATPase, T2SS/T4P/T4SS family [Polyangiaceae bacterium]|nr:ATPase, T2SS/T4P/T4SS family [Polyangiaceae bacterium]
MTALLHFEITAPDRTEYVTCPADAPVRIGRDTAAEVPLLSPNVSRRHACVTLTDEGLQIADTSANGTVVNGLALHKASRLITGDSATLEISLFRIRIWSAAPANGNWTLDDVPCPKTPDVDSGPRQIEATPSQLGQALAPRKLGSPIPAPPVELRRRIHRLLLEYLDLPSLDRTTMDPVVMRPKVVAGLRRIVAELSHELPSREHHESLVQELADEAVGLGPLERLLGDPDVNEIMVVDPHTIFVERRGKMELTSLRFTDDDSVRAVIERIVTPLGRRIDESTPLVDARLRDGSRVNAVIPPLALRGPCITIRKFTKEPLRMGDLERFGSVTQAMARFLERSVKVRRNIVISGGTGSGKTTLLNVLSAAIPAHERVVTIEDAAELQLAQPHVVSLEARPPNLEGKGEYSIRDLVKNALRMRPDRIVVGECRGGEAIDMLQAMNTGHEGSLTTTHANSPREAVARIETLCLMAGLDLPIRAIRQQIAASVHLIVQQTRFSDGSRRVSSIAEVVGIEDSGEVELQEIFSFKVTKVEDGGRVEGEFVASGYLPSFIEQFARHGLVGEGAAL